MYVCRVSINSDEEMLGQQALNTQEEDVMRGKTRGRKERGRTGSESRRQKPKYCKWRDKKVEMTVLI